MNRIKTILLKIRLPKIKLSKPRLPKIKLPKISLPKVNLGKIKALGLKMLPPIKSALKMLVKAIKGFLRWIGKAVKESIAQVWTLLGFFIAWLTLTGTAQQIVGIATIAATILWLITIPLREEKE